MVIKLDVRKMFRKSTTNADARSVCGRNFVVIIIFSAQGISDTEGREKIS